MDSTPQAPRPPHRTPRVGLYVYPPTLARLNRNRDRLMALLGRPVRQDETVMLALDCLEAKYGWDQEAK